MQDYGFTAKLKSVCYRAALWLSDAYISFIVLYTLLAWVTAQNPAILIVQGLFLASLALATVYDHWRYRKITPPVIITTKTFVRQALYRAVVIMIIHLPWWITV